MSAIQKQIVEEFCRRLERMEGFSAPTVEGLRTLLLQDKKAKADDLVRVLTQPAKERVP